MQKDINQGYPKILFFSSSHCTPCKPVEEMLKRINISMFGKKLYIQKIDIEQNRRLTLEHRITSVPTLIIAEKKISINITDGDIIYAIIFAFISSVKI